MSEATTQAKPEQQGTEAAEQALSSRQNDVLDQLLKPEVQESLTTLVEHLPKLTELVTLMSKSYDFAQTVAKDDVLKSDTVGAIKEVAGPVVEKVKDLTSSFIEAKDRAEASTEVISLFGLMKMLKDPQLQKMLRIANAFLQIREEREKQHK